MSCTTTTIRALCATAFASVALSMSTPTLVHAADPANGAPAAAPRAAAAGALPAGTVALVNGVAIPQAQLDDAVRAFGQPDTPQLRQALRQQLIVRELFRQGAEKGHYDTKPEVQAAMNAAKVNAETQLYLKDNIHPEPVTDAQMKARHEGIVASLGKEEYKPRVIAVADEGTAKTVLVALKSGTAFDAAARQFSIAPTRTSGGELPWVSFKAVTLVTTFTSSTHRSAALWSNTGV